MDKKTFFVDLDGTLLTKEKKVTERTKSALAKIVESGHNVIICTGRYVGWYPRYVEGTPIRYVIGSNGAHIYDWEKNKSLYQNPMDTEKLIEIIKFSSRPGIYFNFSAGNGAYATEHTRQDISAFRYTTYIGDQDIEQWLRKNKVYQVNFIAYDIHVIRQLRDDLIAAEMIEGSSCMQMSNQSKALSDPAKYAVNNYSFFEINKGGCNKGVAIKKFCELFNIKLENTIGIGDDRNDKRMFSAVAYKVAMGNGLQEIRDLADRVIGTNQDDGVAVFWEKYYV